MKHAAWLQDRSPSHALNGKTPYEMGHKKKPNLHGIQEFGTAAYVKDLSEPGNWMPEPKRVIL